jgi:hypothetical protein
MNRAWVKPSKCYPYRSVVLEEYSVQYLCLQGYGWCRRRPHVKLGCIGSSAMPRVEAALALRLLYNLYFLTYFLVKTIFLSHNKSVNSTFSYDFSAKWTGSLFWSHHILVQMEAWSTQWRPLAWREAASAGEQQRRLGISCFFFHSTNETTMREWNLI